MAGHHHRASSGLKQKNKSHKTTKSNRAQKRASGAGRVERAGPGRRAGAAAGAKEQRRRRAQQLKDQRQRSSRKPQATDAPLTCAVVPLAENAAVDVASALREDNIQVIETAHGDVRSALRAAAACDVVVCVLAPTKKTDMDTEEPETYSPEADDVLTALKSQGLPTIVGVAAGSAPDAYRLDIARRFFKDEFGDAVPWCDGAANAPQAVRAAPSKLPRWRQTRSRIHVKNASSSG